MASPAAIITYIGIPLAVLGISPILYNFIIAFFVKLRLKRQLKTVGLVDDTVIRSRFINGVVELELPIYELKCEEGCPSLRARLRWKDLGDIGDASWINFECGERGRQEPYFQRCLVGRVTKTFQISSILPLPEVSVSFEHLLRYLLQNERKKGGNIDLNGFGALKTHNLDIPVGTVLVRIATSLEQCLFLKTAASSLENRGFLCLKLCSNVSYPFTSELSKDDDYFSKIERKKWVSKAGLITEDKIWILEETNRYFIREPSSPASSSAVPDGVDQVANTAKQDENTFDSQAIVPKRGVYVWVDVTGIRQAFAIDGLGPNNEPVQLEEIDKTHHIMAPTAGLGKTIKLEQRILDNPLLTHAFASLLELNNHHKLPQFEYSPDVLSTAVFASFTFGNLHESVRLAMYKRQSSPDSALDQTNIADSLERFPSQARERERESLTKINLLANTHGNIIVSSIPKTLMKRRRKRHSIYKNSPSFKVHFRISQLRLYLDLFLWQEICHTAARSPGNKAWPHFLSRSTVPTMEEILYWILLDQDFATAIVEQLMLIGRESCSPAELRNLPDTHPVFFFCAIVLMDGVAGMAERFGLIDDVRGCVKRFPRVYLR
ncbi:uncharacterized protein EAF02_008681 [Botrytis sinoallii]|uniref:uncharacterized protein n=1 Tax=Botrytis sinoallii TaxID=1463999 RepID=UPI0019022E6F|nr:uncharacterized protein EAF02_008681 [Botrytis sinoallii]KAF7874704.1 hypothetical protein EAF02_008681 [Botrytis sinoallii]